MYHYTGKQRGMLGLNTAVSTLVLVCTYVIPPHLCRSSVFAVLCYGVRDFIMGLTLLRRELSHRRARDSPEWGPNTYVGRYGVLCMARYVRGRGGQGGMELRYIRVKSPLSLPRSVVHGKRMMGCRVASWGIHHRGRRQLGTFGEADLFFLLLPSSRIVAFASLSSSSRARKEHKLGGTIGEWSICRVGMGTEVGGAKPDRDGPLAAHSAHLCSLLPGQAGVHRTTEGPGATGVRHGSSSLPSSPSQMLSRQKSCSARIGEGGGRVQYPVSSWV